MASEHPWWGPARVPFLLLTPACMALGVAWSAWQLAQQGLSLNALDALLCVLGALAAHVAVNALNEHHDFRSGLDQRTQRTPFSGGSGVLPANPALAPVAWAMGWGALLFTVLTGLYFVVSRPALLWDLAPLGLVGVAVVVSYTPWLTRHPWLCLMAPGLGFGPLMLLGTEVVLTGAMSWQGLALSALPFFLANNLLLLNQFPDVDADRSVGRRTLPLLLGRAGSVPVLGLQYGLAFGAVLLGLALGWWPAATGLAVLGLPLAVSAWQRAQAHADDLPGLQPAMALNVAVNLITPVLAALGLALSI